MPRITLSSQIAEITAVAPMKCSDYIAWKRVARENRIISTNPTNERISFKTIYLTRCNHSGTAALFDGTFLNSN